MWEKVIQEGTKVLDTLGKMRAHQLMHQGRGEKPDGKVTIEFNEFDGGGSDVIFGYKRGCGDCSKLISLTRMQLAVLEIEVDRIVLSKAPAPAEA